jgi:hypothetical protein
MVVLVQILPQSPILSHGVNPLQELKTRISTQILPQSPILSHLHTVN